MRYKHTNRPGFLLGLIDFCTAGLFFLVYMPLGLQDEIDEILGHKTQRYWVAYVLGIPTMFIYTLVWMARIAEELRGKAKELGIEAPYTSWWHMFGWNTFGVLLFGPAVATHRFFDTLNRIENRLKQSGMRKAIIIGATSGIGRETAARLVKEGWEIGIAGRRTEALEAFRNEFGEAVHIATMDVTRPDARHVLDALLEEMGAPNLFFYVSGVGYQNRELDLDKEILTIQTNCEGMVRLVDHFINYVREHPETYTKKKMAHIAVVTSIAGTTGMGTAPAYSATKKMQQTYLSALSQLARMEKIPVRFTDIRPGFVATDILNPDKKYPMLLSKEKATDEVMKAISRKKRIHTFDWKFRILVMGWRLIPRWVWERMTWVKN